MSRPRIRTEINWCADGADADSVFPADDEPVTRFKPGIDYGLLLVTGGVFPSVSQARKHGYTGPVPDGWTELKVNGYHIFIYNPPANTVPWEDYGHVPGQYRDLYMKISDGVLDLSKPQPEMERIRSLLDPYWVRHFHNRLNDIDFGFAAASFDSKRKYKWELIEEECQTANQVDYGVWCIAIQ